MRRGKRMHGYVSKYERSTDHRKRNRPGQRRDWMICTRHGLRLVLMKRTRYGRTYTVHACPKCSADIGLTNRAAKRKKRDRRLPPLHR